MDLEFKEKPEIKEKNPRFADYVYILYKWRKFFLINLIIVVVVTTIIVLILPNQYKAIATVSIPPDNQSGLGGLASLIGGGKSSAASMGARLFGVTNQSEDMILGLCNSRSALTKIIKKYNLMQYYEINDNNIDKALKALRGDISADPNEYGMIDFSVVNKDPKLSAEIANFMVSMTDSLNIVYNTERAKNDRIFIEKRYLKNISDLKNAEDSLYKFQKKYGIVAVPEQLEVTVKAAAEVEAQLMKKEMEAYFARLTYGENSPQYNGILAEQNLLKSKVQELKNSQNLSSSSNVLYPFKEMPDIAIQYLRYYREVELQQTIMEFVLPMYEQAKVEEQKSMPTLMVIDKAVPPELKFSPKRSSIILGIFFLSLFFLTPIVFWGEKAISRSRLENSLQIKESNLFTKIAKIYGLKF